MYPPTKSSEGELLPLFTPDFIDFVSSHLEVDPLRLALQQKKYPHIDLRSAVKCIEGWRKLSKKLPQWAIYADVLIPDPVMVEQASSHETALYKTRFVPRDTDTATIVDLSGGLGVDSSLFAQVQGSSIHYLDKSPSRVALARHNFSALGLPNISTHTGSAEVEGLALVSQLTPDLVYIDPDRRADISRRTYYIEDSTPNILTLLPLIRQKSPLSTILIKLSPMVDISYIESALSAYPMSIHVLSLQRECKELLVHIAPRYTHTEITAVELFKTHTTLLQTDLKTSLKPQCTTEILPYLYDLYPSISKIGLNLYPALAEKVSQPHPLTHLYFSDQELEDFPGRGFKVIEAFPWQKSRLKELKGRQFNIISKNTGLSPQDLSRDLKVKDGGDLYLFCFALGDKGKRHFAIAERL